MEKTIEAMKERLSALIRELDECHDYESIQEVTGQIAEVGNWLAENGEPMNDETKNPTMEPMSNAEAQRTKSKYCCSACWSHLNIYNKRGKLFVLCPDCQENTPGYVSKHWVERRKSESHAEVMDARHNLKQALPFLNEHAKRDAADILAEIGF